MIDVHVHLAAFPDEENGCFMSEAYQKGILARMVRWKLGLKGKTNQELNKSYRQKLKQDLEKSKFVSKAVLLALDGVYDSSGELDKKKTHMLISNSAVFEACEEAPDLFYPGASVNPARRDALDELNRVIEKGAKLIKVLPPSQVFDPMDKKYQSFFRVLAEKKIPLLSHIGYEFSVTAGKQEYGFPERLRLALDEGVLVIGAHACSSAIFIQKSFFQSFLTLTEKYPNFFVDLSATTLPNRASVLFQLKKFPTLFDRLLFGSDYPLSAYATPFLGRLSPTEQIQCWTTKNIFDKQAKILKALNIHINPNTTKKLLRIP